MAAILILGCSGTYPVHSWSRDILTEHSRVSKRTIVDFERGARSPHASTLFAIQTAFETAGIEFIDENGGGAGLRFRDRH